MDPIQIILAPETLEALKVVNAVSLFDKWLPVGAAIGGAFIGGVVSYLPNRWLEKHKRGLEVDAVRNALVTEIKSIVAIVQERAYVELMDEVIALLIEKGGKQRYSVRVPEHYTRVYQAQVSRIGLLDPSLATQIITFYQLLDSVVQDVSPGGIVADLGGDLSMFRKIKNIFGTAMDLAQQIISDDDARRSNSASDTTFRPVCMFLKKKRYFRRNPIAQTSPNSPASPRQVFSQPGSPPPTKSTF
jgi:hypothetical protein